MNVQMSSGAAALCCMLKCATASYKSADIFSLFLNLFTMGVLTACHCFYLPLSSHAAICEGMHRRLSSTGSETV